MNRKSIFTLLPAVLLGIILVTLVILGGAAAGRFLNTPLAEPMSLKTAPEAEAALQPAVPAQKATSTNLPDGICGESGTMTLLFTGADFSGGVPPLGADAIRVVKVDFSQQTMNIVAFPRDLLLKVDGLKEQGRNQERLGLAYYYKKEAASGTDQDKITTATNLVAQVLYDNFTVLPEHYFTLQLDSIEAMVDVFGGVEITLPEAITTDRGVTFPAGTQTLDGSLSAEFLRAYKPGGDPARLKRQNLFMKALRSKVLSAGVAAKTSWLLEKFHEAIVTDLTPEQLASLACVMEKIPAEATKFYEIEGDMVVAQTDGALQPVMGKIRQMLGTALGTRQQ